MKKYVIAIYVDNKYGVLARVSGLFMRKGFNIDSLTVSETDDPGYSRITVTVRCDEYSRDQLILQVKKLYNVKQIKLLETNNFVDRELMLIKVANSAETRSEVMAATEIYRAKIIDYTTNAMCIEMTGEPSKLDSFIEVMKPLGILEICRTGIVALERGNTTLDTKKVNNIF